MDLGCVSNGPLAIASARVMSNGVFIDLKFSTVKKTHKPTVKFERKVLSTAAADICAG